MKNKKEVLKMKRYEVVKGFAILLIIFILIPGCLGYVETHYNRENCVVVELTNEYATAKDVNGDVWSWNIDKNNDIKVGDIVTLKMHNGYTDNTINDDMVIGVK
jgi:hypothetical protein